MRIIAGSARRTALEVARGSSTRPFLEMARGALFNSMGEAVIGARTLDLYAGSGALGLEALSRGAERCLFVENDPLACKALEKNIAKCRMSGRARLARGDAFRVAASEPGPYDLIFVDPPFPELKEWRGGGRADGLMRETARLLADGGVLVFRLEDGKALPPAWPGLALGSDRRYGRSRVCRYGKDPGALPGGGPDPTAAP